MATHQLVFFVAGVIGFGPAIAVLYHALRTFDYPFTARAFFESKKVFLALAVGMVVGTASGAITVALRAGIFTLVGLAIALLLLAFFEEAFKAIYLNRRGYRGRFDTTFYGVPLGIGIAAIVAAGSSYTNGPDVFLPAIALQLAVFSASFALVHAATGAILGYGGSRKELLPAFAKAYVARAIHGAMLLPFFVGAILPAPQSLAIPLFSLGAATVFTFALYVYAYRFVIPETLPPDLRRERRRRFRNVRSPGE